MRFLLSHHFRLNLHPNKFSIAKFYILVFYLSIYFHCSEHEFQLNVEHKKRSGMSSLH